MTEVLQGDQEDLDMWMNHEAHSDEEWRSYFKRKGFATGCDFPFALLWKKFADIYPDAKVVLSTRDPDTWYDSVISSIWLFNDLARDSWSFRLLLKAFDMRKGSENWIRTVETIKGHGMSTGLGAAIQGGPETAKQFFLDWQESVM